MATFRWTTVAAFRQALREEFRTARGMRLCRLAAYINSLSLTDTQLRNLFGVTAGQLPALKTRLSALEAKYNDVISQVGE